MKLRRRLTFAVGAAGAGHALRLFAQTPTPSAKRLGILTQGVRANAQPFFETFADEMGRAGWQQGRSIVYDWSSADGRQALLRQRAEELVARKPDVIYAGSQAGALAAKQEGDTLGPPSRPRQPLASQRPASLGTGSTRAWLDSCSR